MKSNIKDVLEELCFNLELDLNSRDFNENRTVKLFSGVRDESYIIPEIFLGRKRLNKLNKPAWFVEISIDEEVIFMEYYIPKDGEDLGIVEAMLLNRVLRNIFTFGVMHSKEFLDKMR